MTVSSVPAAGTKTTARNALSPNSAAASNTAPAAAHTLSKTQTAVPIARNTPVLKISEGDI